MKETYRCEYVRCGKSACRSCPHGPYWYAYYRREGRLKKRYIGKEAPAGIGPREAEKMDPRDAIFLDRTATRTLACEILGIPRDADRATARRVYLAGVREKHPDTGGDKHEFALWSAAWSFLNIVLP